MMIDDEPVEGWGRALTPWKVQFARRMLGLGYKRWDAVLRGAISWDECAAGHIEDLLADDKRGHGDW